MRRTTEMAARVASKTFYGGDGTLYKDLKPGERFYFPTNELKTVCTKLTGGRYRLDDHYSEKYRRTMPGGVFRTGSTTAVIRVTS